MGGPLIVQSDMTILLDAHDPLFEEARVALSPFAVLEKSPEHMHTYRLTPLSLWNAASAGLGADAIENALARFSRYEVPSGVIHAARDFIARFGTLVLHDDPDADSTSELFLECADPAVAAEIAASRRLVKYLVPRPGGFGVLLADRGTVKQELIRLGRPVRDEARLSPGDPFTVSLRDTAASGSPFTLRPYQDDAVAAFMGGNTPGNGYGVIVLPCGSGKTVVGMAVMSAVGRKTLIVTTNIAAAHQWMDELHDKTAVAHDDIGEYSGERKIVKPITVATYQILTWRQEKGEEFPHFDLFRKQKWGLVIFDEVHLLPAPVFRVVAEIQAVRRLGLTATLVREDGHEEDVFSLVGPKRCDVPWKELERRGFIATAVCREVRIPLPQRDQIRYAAADQRARIRIAAENSRKVEAVLELVENHPEDRILVIGQYLDQLGALAQALKAPLITGKIPNPERERIYSDFKSGKERIIVVSKVANFAVDLPDASMAIQTSGTFGSRQEEAQRLGRILRPKKRNSYFYSLVSLYTIEEEFSSNRRRFLTEQGYRYAIEAWDEAEWN
ncbi:MAG: DEAD/DEAH box helicase [Spirochaetes bacterium]|nr:DEAD/DEAH box helicase [Spirochaetota bacterium]